MAITIAISGLIGVLLGRTIHDIAVQPNLAAMFAPVAIVGLAAALTVLVAVGACLLAFRDRAAGSLWLLGTGSMAIGAFAALLIGSRL